MEDSVYFSGLETSTVNHRFSRQLPDSSQRGEKCARLPILPATSASLSYPLQVTQEAGFLGRKTAGFGSGGMAGLMVQLRVLLGGTAGT